MKIPSQFNEDSLYGRKRRRGERTEHYRQLIRLVLGLALVFVVMHQASKPEVYAPFFGVNQESYPVGPMDVAANVEGGGDRERSTKATATRDAENERGGDEIDFDLLAETLDQANQVPVEQQQALLRTLYDFQSSGAEQDTFGESNMDEFPIKSDDAINVKSWISALTKLAESRVVDGSVWHSADRDSLFLYLDEFRRTGSNWSGRKNANGFTQVGVLPLLQQPDVYLAKEVTFKGRVARIIQQDAGQNAFDFNRYWQLWMRPSNGVQRPLLAVVGSVPEKLMRFVGDSEIRDAPALTIHGRFLKRLSYRSSLGADLTPVIVGRVMMNGSNQVASTGNGPSRQSQNRSVSGFLPWMVAATLIGIGIASLVLWRTAVSARLSRALRAKQFESVTSFESIDIYTPTEEQER